MTRSSGDSASGHRRARGREHAGSLSTLTIVHSKVRRKMSLKASDHVPPASGLPAAARRVWRKYAPLAIAEGTLVRTTEPGFRLLCQLAAFTEAEVRRVARGGAAGRRALRHYERLSPLLMRALARFGLG